MTDGPHHITKENVNELKFYGYKANIQIYLPGIRQRSRVSSDKQQVVDGWAASRHQT